MDRVLDPRKGCGHPLQEGWGHPRIRDGWKTAVEERLRQADSPPRPCFCIGPQGGERLCPCALREERRREAEMLRDGVVVAGRRYRLVPA